MVIIAFAAACSVGKRRAAAGEITGGGADARPGPWRKHLVRAAIRSPGKRSATGALPQQRSAKSLLAQLSEQEEDILACAEANDKKNTVTEAIAE